MSYPESPAKAPTKEMIPCKSDVTKIAKKRTLYLKTEKWVEKKDIEPKIEILNPPFIDYSQIPINKTFSTISLILKLLSLPTID